MAPKREGENKFEGMEGSRLNRKVASDETNTIDDNVTMFNAAQHLGESSTAANENHRTKRGMKKGDGAEPSELVDELDVRGESSSEDSDDVGAVVEGVESPDFDEPHFGNDGGSSDDDSSIRSDLLDLEVLTKGNIPIIEETEDDRKVLFWVRALDQVRAISVFLLYVGYYARQQLEAMSRATAGIKVFVVFFLCYMAQVPFEEVELERQRNTSLFRMLFSRKTVLLLSYVYLWHMGFDQSIKLYHIYEMSRNRVPAPRNWTRPSVDETVPTPFPALHVDHATTENLVKNYPPLIILQRRKAADTLFSADSVHFALPKVYIPSIIPVDPPIVVNYPPLVMLQTSKVADVRFSSGTVHFGLPKVYIPSFIPLYMLQGPVKNYPPFVLLPTPKKVAGILFTSDSVHIGLPKVYIPSSIPLYMLQGDIKNYPPVVILPTPKKVATKLFTSDSVHFDLPKVYIPKFIPLYMLQGDIKNYPPVIILPTPKKVAVKLFTSDSVHFGLPKVYIPSFIPLYMLQGDIKNYPPVIILPTPEKIAGILFTSDSVHFGLPKVYIPKHFPVAVEPDQWDTFNVTVAVEISTKPEIQEPKVRRKRRRPLKHVRRVLLLPLRPVGAVVRIFKSFLLGEDGVYKNQAMIDNLGEIWFSRDWR